jgi:hypothetical protein
MPCNGKCGRLKAPANDANPREWKKWQGCFAANDPSFRRERAAWREEGLSQGHGEEKKPESGK